MRALRLLGAATALMSLVPSVAVQAAPTLCTSPSRDGDVTLGSGIVNTYFPASGNPTSGTGSITIGAADTRGASTGITAGDLLLVIQIQGATLNSTNSTAYGSNSGSGRGYAGLANGGNYEYVRALNSVSSAGGSVSITPLANGYTTATATTSNTARARFQVIRVPQYRNATISGTVTAPKWNGATGGVVAFDVANVANFAGGSVNVDGAGFRGGGGASSRTGVAYAVAGTPDYATSLANNAANGTKGESISGTPLRVYDGTTVTTLSTADIAGGLSNARGAPANGGGGGTDGNPATNEQNSGGGGGSNGGQGGQGGYTWCQNYNFTLANGGCIQSGGLGGVALPNAGKADIFMGGGGGAGSMNDATGEASGAPGGGIVMIRSGDLAGTGTLNANGGTFTSASTNDATGGGGGGGSIQIFSLTRSGSIVANARGGNGISNTGGGSSHGPGGGGGGGVIVSNVTLSTNVNGGSAGTTASSGSYGVNYGATAGSAGIVDTAYASTGISGRLYSGAECTPVVTKAFAQSTIANGGISRLTVTLANPNPTLALTASSVTDTLPTNVSVFQTPGTATTCTAGTVTASAGGQTAAISGATVAAAGSCSYSANVTSSVNGTYVNTIPVAGLAGTIGGGSTTSATPTSATLTVTPGLTISKLSKAIYDPYNNLVNPKSIPGGYVQYSLTVTNPSTLAVTADSVVMSDAIPNGTSLIVSPLYAQQAYPGARGPFQYLDGTRGDGTTGNASGLTFTYVSAGDTTDSPSFSSDGTTFGYTPTADANFTDTSAKAVQFRMFGTMAPNSVFTVNFLVRVN
jgi:hypothetical protein